MLGVGLISSAALGHAIARRGIQPIRRVTRTVQNIGSSTLHERIDATGFPAELVGLATTLNGMLDRLEDAFARLTRFSGDIAHELRTPINILRGEAEVALTKSRSDAQYREVLGSSLEECARLSRLIDRLLFLARAESPASQVVKEPVDIGAELGTLCDFYEIAAGEAGISLTLFGSAGVIRSFGAQPSPPALTDAEPAEEPPETAGPVRIGPVAELDRTLFQRAVGNLIENALSHTPHGGAIDVRARIVTDCGRPELRVDVSDTGRGIPAADLPYVFDRFHRVDASRSKVTGGAGLGLAIVRTIATLHGGSASIVSELGRGTTVTLRFPQFGPTMGQAGLTSPPRGSALVGARSSQPSAEAGREWAIALALSELAIWGRRRLVPLDTIGRRGRRRSRTDHAMRPPPAGRWHRNASAVPMRSMNPQRPNPSNGPGPQRSSANQQRRKPADGRRSNAAQPRGHNPEKPDRSRGPSARRLRSAARIWPLPPLVRRPARRPTGPTSPTGTIASSATTAANITERSSFPERCACWR